MDASMREEERRRVSPVRVEFETPPEIGHQLSWEGHTFQVLAKAPHTRIDGAPSILITWGGVCPLCENQFIQTTGFRGWLRWYCKWHSRYSKQQRAAYTKLLKARGINDHGRSA